MDKEETLFIIKHLYSSLISCGSKQLVLLEAGLKDNIFNEVVELEKFKDDEFKKLSALTIEADMTELSEDVKRELIQHIYRFNEVNSRLETQLKSLYKDASKEMKQVSTHRKTIESYGGANSPDVISYYFDLKK